MSDIEVTKLCAEAMGLSYKTSDECEDVFPGSIGLYDKGSNMWHSSYNPLWNDAQAFALVKKLRLHISETRSGDWHVCRGVDYDETNDPDLNRAVCICVARLQSAKAPA